MWECLHPGKLSRVCFSLNICVCKKPGQICGVHRWCTDKVQLEEQVMGHWMGVTERWWWLHLNLTGHGARTESIVWQLRRLHTHSPVPWCSKLLASNHVEWRPIIVCSVLSCWKLQHKYSWAQMVECICYTLSVQTVRPLTDGFPRTAQLTHNLHMRWHEGGSTM